MLALPHRTCSTLATYKKKNIIRGPELNTNFFLKLFGQFRDIPAKSRDIPPKKFDFPGFEGRIELFAPPPVHVEDPHPTRKYPDQKVWVRVPFSSLNYIPFVRIHSGNNSKIIFLCICICYEIENNSETIFICYATPSNLQRTAVPASATNKNNSKIIFVCICICYEMHN